MAEWTPNEVETLKRLYPRHDLTTDEIADKIRTKTPNAIRLMASRLGLHKPTLQDLRGSLEE